MVKLCKVKSIKNNLLFGLIKTHSELIKKLETKYYAFNNRTTRFSTELTKFYNRSMKKNHQRSNKWLNCDLCKVKSIKSNLLFGLIKTHIELTKKLETKYYAFNNRITSFSTKLTKFYDQSMKKNHQRSMNSLIVICVKLRV